MLEHAYRQKSKLHSEKVADSTSKLLHSRRRMSAMGVSSVVFFETNVNTKHLYTQRTLEEHTERVNAVQVKFSQQEYLEAERRSTGQTQRWILSRFKEHG